MVRGISWWMSHCSLDGCKGLCASVGSLTLLCGELTGNLLYFEKSIFVNQLVTTLVSRSWYPNSSPNSEAFIPIYMLKSCHSSTHWWHSENLNTSSGRWCDVSKWLSQVKKFPQLRNEEAGPDDLKGPWRLIR